MDDFGNEFSFWVSRAWCAFVNDGVLWDGYTVIAE